MEEKKDDHHLDKYFERINELYGETNSENDVSTGIKFKIVTTVWKMLERSEYWKYIYDDNPKNDLSVKIHNEIIKCIGNYVEYHENNPDVPFSKFLYHDLRTYVFRPYISTFQYVGKYDVSVTKAKELHCLNKQINDYKKTNCKEPDFNDHKIMRSFCFTTGFSEEKILELLEIQSKSIISVDYLSDVGSKTKEVPDTKNVNQEEIEVVLAEAKRRLEIIQNEWKTTIKSELTRSRVSALFTWNFLKESNIPAEAIVYRLMDDFEILDNEIIRKFYQGKYNDSFDQKDIAKELGIDSGYANHLLNRDFLDKIKSKYAKVDHLGEKGGLI